MENTYSVQFGTQQVGKVQVWREGLYYRFFCRCRISGDVVCRLAVRSGEKEEILGVVVPVGEDFGLEKRIPAKRLGEGQMEFFLVTKGSLPIRENRQTGQFVPIYPEEPFAYIAQLKEAFFIRQNGQAGVMIK